jgi:cysteine desulfurase/selenocysteine lyase
MEKSIYFDNAATSWPKPEGVAASMTAFLNDIGANPGRSGHRLSVKASRVVYETRELIARMFGVRDPLRITFAHNITGALNRALHGILRPGDHIITSSMEHNSMMRPLRALEKMGVELTILPCTGQGELDPEEARKAIKGNTKLIALLHASNVTGTLLPIKEIGSLTRSHNLLFLVDTAQTAGAVPVNMEADDIDLLAFTGHKSLYGPTGTGGLIIGERVDLSQFHPEIMGGTGSWSEKEEQPTFLPDKFESGTLNAVGLAGLLTSVHWLLEKGVKKIQKEKEQLSKYVINNLMSLSGVTVYGTLNERTMTSVVSFTVKDISPSEIGRRLDEEYNIFCRVGLHCAPSAHKTIGTFPAGTVRFGLGVFNTKDEIDYSLQAIHTIIEESR